jgi:hypothetical protein
LWAAEGPAGTTLLFQIHHAACDGGGLFAFLSEIVLLVKSFVPIIPARLTADRILFGRSVFFGSIGLVAVPPVAIATPDAYTWWDDQNPSPNARGPVALDPEAFATWGSIGRLGGNDFEQPVFGRYPELRALYERMAETGPMWVRLSGSGSAIAAVYKQEGERDEAAQRIGEKQQRLIKTATKS